MRKNIFCFVCIILILCFYRPTHCSAASHCYAKKSIAVLSRYNQQVATIRKGTTFTYLAESQGYIKFKYYGKVRYARTKNLILNDNISNYVKNHPSKFSQQIKMTSSGKVTTTSGNVLYHYRKNEHFKIFGSVGDYYQVKVDGKLGYLQSQKGSAFNYVNVTEFYRALGNTKRERIINYAEKFIGNPYIWGGTSLTSGCDCSGFTMGVLGKFGILLPHYSGSQAKLGKPVSIKNAQPGDLLFFSHSNGVIHHVAIYAGNNYMIEAKGARWGIVKSKINLNTVACIRDYL